MIITQPPRFNYSGWTVNTFHGVIHPPCILYINHLSNLKFFIFVCIVLSKVLCYYDVLHLFNVVFQFSEILTASCKLKSAFGPTTWERTNFPLTMKLCVWGNFKTCVAAIKFLSHLLSGAVLLHVCCQHAELESREQPRARSAILRLCNEESASFCLSGGSHFGSGSGGAGMESSKSL